MKTNRLLAIICGLSLLFAFAAPAATTNSWKSAVSGKWETSGNWSLHAPSSLDGIEVITNAATKTITIDATTTSSTNTLSISNLYVAGTASSSNILFLNNAGTNTPLQILSGGFNTFAIETNASLVVNASAIVATNSSSILTIGSHGGHSFLTISNGAVVSCDSAQLGGSNNAMTVMGTGSVWNLQGNLLVGTSGTGNTFTVSNGGVVKNGPNTVSYVGVDFTSRSNVVIVTGAGSVWNAGADLLFGYECAGNVLTITNGGTVVANLFQEGGVPAASNNLVLVTGTGSVLSNSNGPFGTPGTLIIGNESVGNTLMIANGGEVLSGTGGMGFNSPGSNNFATVTGTGSVWNLIRFNIGMVAGGNKVTIANSGMVLASNLFVGSFGTSPSNNLLQVSGGSLFATNSLGTGLLVIGPGGLSNAFVLDSGSATVDNFMAPTAGGSSRIFLNGGTLTVRSAVISNGLDFIIGGTNTSATYIASGGAQFFENNLVVQRGTFTMNGGTVTVSQLVLTNGPIAAAAINSGQFNTAGTFVTNGAQFVIGNGVAHANYHLLGGEHDFHDGLRISNGASLTGCGTITGDVTIDAGGSIYATCETLTFTGTVINNGALAANGATLEFYGTVINNNGLLFYNSGTTNFHGTFMNNGIITNAGSVIVTSITRTGNDVIVTTPSALDFDYQLQIANTQILPVWTNSGTIQPGTGSPLTFTDPGGATNRPNRYYQIDVIWPP